MSHNPRLTPLNITKPSTGSGTDEKFTFTYDGTLLTSIVQSGLLNETIDYTYNNDFNPTSITYANKTQNYSYNQDNQPIQIDNFTLTRNNKDRNITITDGTYTKTSNINKYGELKKNRRQHPKCKTQKKPTRTDS